MKTDHFEGKFGAILLPSGYEPFDRLEELYIVTQEAKYLTFFNGTVIFDSLHASHYMVSDMHQEEFFTLKSYADRAVSEQLVFEY